MGNKKGRRQFGNIRRLASGRYQASYLGLDGLRRTADHTFDTKTDANNWLTVKQSELLRGDWIDPNRGRITLDEYSRRWLAERPLGDRTRDRYASLLRLHVLPLLGSKSLSEITTDVVRSWRHELSERGRGNGTVVKSYRLLRAILSTAVDDERIRRNPCRIKGADKEGSPERPVASIPQVFALATLVPSRFRVLVLMAGFTGLRWGELAGLRRTDVDLTNGYVHVRRNLKQLDSGRLVEGPPKSAAGYRRVALPSELVDDLRAHLDEYAAEPTARVFTGAGGGDLRRDNWHRDADWKRAIQRAGLPPEFRFHDLRHTGNHLASLSGANTRELMRRMGHSSMRAALIYQHATDERDHEIAAALGALVAAQRLELVSDDEDDEDGDDGAAGALVPAS